jgi:hypothetical protein
MQSNAAGQYLPKLCDEIYCAGVVFLWGHYGCSTSQSGHTHLTHSHLLQRGGPEPVCNHCDTLQLFIIIQILQECPLYYEECQTFHLSDKLHSILRDEHSNISYVEYGLAVLFIWFRFLSPNLSCFMHIGVFKMSRPVYSMFY